MGLDMWLKKRPKKEEELMYWRKANQIRGWIADHVTGFNDNGETVVAKEDLEELLKVCESVIEHKSEQYSASVLPVTSGFFFGSNEYDDYYYEDVSDTIDVLKEILENVDFDNYDVVYEEWY